MIVRECLAHSGGIEKESVEDAYGRACEGFGRVARMRFTAFRDDVCVYIDGYDVKRLLMSSEKGYQKIETL